ncbi:hypothetical protein H5410_025305 [Solanum commersonii]|uniref:Uncharacterized protein n=1 Tax=Solanum commersonii TaxID=4109 RepID=A0A9J5YVE3_SOLCO|nr:hypothetical protein H5410_025305 [Solanum commersonii]
MDKAISEMEQGVVWQPKKKKTLLFLMELDLKELSQLPTKLFNAVKNYAQGDGVYCRVYNIAMECKDLQAYYPTLNYVSDEKIKDFNVKAIGVDYKLPHLNKKWIQTRRALEIKALYFILKRFYNEDYRIIDQDQDWVLITKGGKSKSKELKERILDIELHRLRATEESWKLACKMLDHNHPRNIILSAFAEDELVPSFKVEASIIARLFPSSFDIGIGISVLTFEMFWDTRC